MVAKHENQEYIQGLFFNRIVEMSRKSFSSRVQLRR